MDDPFEPLIDAADESDDVASAPLPVLERAAAAEPTASEPPAPRPGADVGDVRRLFSQLQIRREADGRVIIEAPAEAASALGALFEGMAALLRSVAETK